jgi:hypothetical protein
VTKEPLDRASDHHDIAVIDTTGALLARRRIDDTAARASRSSCKF